MSDQIMIRPASEADRGFVAGLVPSLLEFASPAWKDVEALAPGFRRVLADAVNRRDPVGQAPSGLDSVEPGHADVLVKCRSPPAGVATLVTFVFAGGAATPSVWLVVRSVGWVLLANSIVCIVAVGLGALMGSRPAALISLVAWQTIATRLLLNTSALGGAGKAVLDAALTQLKPGPHDRGVVMSAVLAVAVIALWGLVATALGAWRTATRDA
jgi:hypothetical protein